MALVDIAHGKTRHVHYRDSKLTFILRVICFLSLITHYKLSLRIMTLHL